MLKNDINIPLLATIGACSAFLLLVILFGVQAWYDWEVDGYFKETWGNSVSQRVKDQKDAQKLNIDSPTRWVDRSKGLAQVPISDAMKVVIETGGKIPTTSPAK
jgi:hypothetical protein